MNKDKKIGLYILLKAIDRANEKIKAMGGRRSKKVELFIESVWKSLGDGGEVRLDEIGETLDSLIVDEQSASKNQIIRNMYYYIISDLIAFLKNFDADYLGYAEESCENFFDYIAAQKYLEKHFGQKAVVLTSEDELAIQEDSEFQHHKNAMVADRLFAEKINQWANVSSFR